MATSQDDKFTMSVRTHDITPDDRLSHTTKWLEAQSREHDTRDTTTPNITNHHEIPSQPPSPPRPPHGLTLYLTLFALCISQLLNALEGTVTSTALPTIVASLGGSTGSSLVIWASSGYFLTSTIFQPLFGQIADLFGRRWLLLSAVVIFTAGSGICGGASTMGVLVLGRMVQGIGGGGVSVLVNIVVCDMFPLRERAKFQAVTLGAISIGTAVGPFLGGVIVQRGAWRWVFLLNVPVGALSALLLWACLREHYPPPTFTLGQKLLRIDYGGQILFATGVSLILVALSYGSTWTWSSWSTILSLVLGFVFLAICLLYQNSSYATNPMLPLRLFSNRTSLAAYAMTFCHSLVTMLLVYFLPVYFQAVLLSSPTEAGVQLLPTVLVLVPAAAVSGILLSKLGRYKPLHMAGFSLVLIALIAAAALPLGATTPTGAWVVLQLLAALGSGGALSTLLPAAQACLADADTAKATAAWAFLRQFGIVWAVAVPVALFDAQAGKLVRDGSVAMIPDAGLAASLTSGSWSAYEHATAEFVNAQAGEVREALVRLYQNSLVPVWAFGAAAAGLAFGLAFVEREVVLRRSMERREEEEVGSREKRGP